VLLFTSNLRVHFLKFVKKIANDYGLCSKLESIITVTTKIRAKYYSSEYFTVCVQN